MSCPYYLITETRESKILKPLQMKSFFELNKMYEVQKKFKRLDTTKTNYKVHNDVME